MVLLNKKLIENKKRKPFSGCDNLFLFFSLPGPIQKKKKEITKIKFCWNHSHKVKGGKRKTKTSQ
tara:strand:- start:72 stop:266 length:195 start_codon:yes stop_codon:yes gene_type:complete